MKKKIIAIAAAVAILAVAIVGGTLAWLTSTDTVTNTFTVGNVSLKLEEDKVGTDGKIITGANAAKVQTNAYNLVSGAVLDKDPTVTVLQIANPAWYMSTSTTSLVALFPSQLTPIGSP
jgi:predicted ribosomally synthesized peptide with SipW-like signal peptide